MKALCLTSYASEQEPRGPKCAVALARSGQFSTVEFVDCRVRGSVGTALPGANIRCRSALVSLRRKQPLRYLLDFCASRLNRAFSLRSDILMRSVRQSDDIDLVVGHNIDALPAIARCGGASTRRVFDCMEYYSEMGDGQSAAEGARVRALEARLLPEMDLVIASSEPVAEALRTDYQLRNVVAIHNTPPIQPKLPPRPDDGKLRLYWRNGTIGLGQRGLGDILEALAILPEEILLTIQGRPGTRHAELLDRIRRLGLGQRVIVADPYAPEEAVAEAAQHDIGLCPERDTCRNQRLTVSNKLYDFMMAGLAVIVSDLPGISSVVQTARSGLVFKNGEVRELADAVLQLWNDPDQLRSLQSQARNYAMEVANQEQDMKRFVDEVAALWH